MSQPWKFPGHPYGELWFDYFRSALAAGAVTPEDIAKSVTRGYARPNIREGNQPRPAARKEAASAKRVAQPRPNWLKRFSRRLRGKAA
jgi:hypothetical protein